MEKYYCTVICSHPIDKHLISYIRDRSYILFSLTLIDSYVHVKAIISKLG